MILMLSVTVSSTKAQLADTTLIRRIDNIELSLQRSHSQFSTGTVFFVAGLMIAGVALAADDADIAQKMSILGSGMMVIGGVIHIDSHKYLGRIRKSKKMK